MVMVVIALLVSVNEMADMASHDYHLRLRLLRTLTNTPDKGALEGGCANRIEITLRQRPRLESEANRRNPMTTTPAVWPGFRVANVLHGLVCNVWNTIEIIGKFLQHAATRKGGPDFL
jgi:hypothetical protein